MPTDIANEQSLKNCFEKSIQIIQNAIEQIRSKKRSSNGTLVTETKADENIYSFTLNQWEENLIVDFKSDFEKHVIEQKTKLENYYQQYFLDVLHQFNYDDKKMEFKEQFDSGILSAFARELQTRLASIDAYRTAWNGDIQTVDEFLITYPAFKDKSGLWGTTLLYSASRNGHLNLVINLIENHQCSVNAQNRQHISRALAGPHRIVNYLDKNTKAGSTALHSACYYGHLNVVKYLVEHGADYYLENQSRQTALKHAALHKNIAEYFHEILVFGYSSSLNNFPKGPMGEQESCYEMDCIWEYKPFGDERWFQFSRPESLQLQESLILKAHEEFQREIYLDVFQGVYGICLMKFLRSGKDLNYSENLAWVRCRGSSLSNFNCYALWQIFLTKHPSAFSDPIFDMISPPTSYDSQFKLHLKTWYFCNAQTNDELDNAMKYRRRYVTIKIPLISDEPLRFNLESFSFTDQQNRICGHLRWVSKMISNNSKDRDEIIDIDEYATMASLNPIPLTTSRLKQIAKINEEQLIKNMDDEDFSSENDRDSIENIPETPIKVTESLTGFFNTSSPLSNNPILENEESEETIDECIDETNVTLLLSREPPIIEQTNSPTNEEVPATLMNTTTLTSAELERKYAELQSSLDTKYEENIRELIQRIETLEQQKKIYEEKQMQLQEISNTLRKVEYINIQKAIIQDFLMVNNSLVLHCLRQAKTDIDSSFNDRTPKMIFGGRNTVSIVTIDGFQEHHDRFKEILKRIQLLLSTVKSAKDFYQRYLNREMYSIMKGILPQVKPQSQIWNEYTQIFFQLFQDKNKEYKQLFDDHIGDKVQSMTDSCIVGEMTNPWNVIKSETDEFIANHLFLNEVNTLKQKALDEFIKENISLQHLRFEPEPTQESISIIQFFIERIQTEFRTDPKYQGCEIKHFNLIPKLLERLLLHYSCFKIQLPLYESSIDLLFEIEHHVITTISTSTGSGGVGGKRRKGKRRKRKI